jgi:hypothetical protein
MALLQTIEDRDLDHRIMSYIDVPTCTNEDISTIM